MTTAEHSVWGRFAYDENARTGSNQSVADYMRLALALGAEMIDATLGESVKAARAEHLRVKQGIVVLAVGCLAICHALAGDDQTLRRARTLRVAKIQRREINA